MLTLWYDSILISLNVKIKQVSYISNTKYMVLAAILFFDHI